MSAVDGDRRMMDGLMNGDYDRHRCWDGAEDASAMPRNGRKRNEMTAVVEERLAAGPTSTCCFDGQSLRPDGELLWTGSRKYGRVVVMGGECRYRLDFGRSFLSKARAPLQLAPRPRARLGLRVPQTQRNVILSRLQSRVRCVACVLFLFPGQGGKKV